VPRLVGLLELPRPDPVEPDGRNEVGILVEELVHLRVNTLEFYGYVVEVHLPQQSRRSSFSTGYALLRRPAKYSAGCRARRPVPPKICSRQDVPGATTSRPAASRTAGKSLLSPIFIETS
jgi:hypothetical protein